jgi:hypothetical protein
MDKPLMTAPEPLIALAIRELLSGPPAEEWLAPAYREKIKILRDHPGTRRLAGDLKGRGDEDNET